jgi:hypothetical protein
MKLMYFSSDAVEVELLRKEFVEAGIPCEVRNGPLPQGTMPNSTYAELWIENERDAHRALMLCVELSVGFAKRARKRPAFDD